MKLLARMFGVSFLMLISAGLLSAQLSLGLKGGVNLAKDHFDDDDIREMTEFMPVMYFAVPVELEISEFFALQAEPGFIQKGVKIFNETTIEYEPGMFRTMDMDLRNKFNFLNLPVLAKAKFGPENLKLFALAGPEIAYAMNGKTKIEMTVTNGTVEEIEETEDIDFDEDGLDRWDYGLILGAGLEAKLGPGWITLDGRYNLGLNNFNAEEDADVKMYHRGIGVLVGFKVPLGN